MDSLKEENFYNDSGGSSVDFEIIATPTILVDAYYFTLAKRNDHGCSKEELLKLASKLAEQNLSRYVIRRDTFINAV